MTRDEAEEYIWEVHDTYFVQHPTAKTFTSHALLVYLEVILPTEEERQELYAALDVETCGQCRAEQGLSEDFCPWCEALAQVFPREETS